MHFVRSIASTVFFAALVACSGTQTSQPAHPLEARDFFPLHRDAAWSFDSEDMAAPGNPGLVVMRVVRDDGAGGFYVQHGTRGAPAMYEFREGALTRNGETILSGPIEAGTRWQGASHDSYVIRNVGLTRTVPAGTFHNVIEVVRSAAEATLVNGTEYRETYFYAPHVGPIEAIVPVMLPSNEVRRFHLSLRGYTLDGQM